MNRKRNLVKSDFSPVFRHFVNLLINRVVVDNLPEEIDEKFLLYHVLLYGRVLFFKKNGKYHVMWFSGKGKLNEYYIQREFLIVNPWAEETSGSYEENNACILYSDMNAYIENADVGLFDFVHDYSEIINSIDASIRALAKNSKVIAFVTGASSSIVNSARQMINTLLNSDNCIGVCEESLVDAIKVNPISEKMDYKFSELIKARQYYISDFYQKLGIANNQNMKAERLTDNESQLIEGVSDVDFKHILDNLNYSAKFINEKFGLNISFRLNEDKEVDDNGVINDGEDTGTISDGVTGEGSKSDGERVNEPDTASGISGSSNDSGDADQSTGEEVTGERKDDEEDNERGVDDNSEVEININIETKEGDVNVDEDNVDKPVDDNSESEEKDKEDKEDEEEKGITKYTDERG